MGWENGKYCVASPRKQPDPHGIEIKESVQILRRIGITWLSEEKEKNNWEKKSLPV